MNQPNTIKDYDKIINICKEIFDNKTKDYGTSWRIHRPSSLTDQIFIKAKRIRTIEQLGNNKINDSIENEYIGIINYCVIAIIQIDFEKNNNQNMNIEYTFISDLYSNTFSFAKSLMIDKNHDYGEAWREMRVSSLTDLILSKVLRIKQIEDNNGNTLISEGIDANYYDIINYAVFALIRLNVC